MLDDVAGGGHVELDVDDTLRYCEVEVSLGSEGEVVGIAEQIEHGEVPIEEHREAVEPEPCLDTVDIVGGWANAVTLGECQHRRRVDRSLQVDVQFGLRHRANDIDRKRGAHRVRRLRTPVGQW